jgi:histidyl-tRNA synthetase
MLTGSTRTHFVLGPDELQSSQVTLKVLATGAQQTVERAGVAEHAGRI